MNEATYTPTHVRVLKNWTDLGMPRVIIPIKITIGKVYTFPRFVCDDGRVLNLNDNIRVWKGNLEPVTEEVCDE